MKYIIDVPDNTKQIDAMYLWHVLKSYPLSELEPYTEPDRKAIEDEVWEFLDFLFTGMSPEERYECFDKVFSHIIVSTMSYQEAKAKYEAWLKQKDEIHVGDEVANLTDYKGVVVKIYDDKTVNVMWDNGNVGNCKTNTFHKTGRHFDEVEELLKKIGSEE